ncbi:hypothetical protein BGY98DRAFT_1046208, partial [Russula aff. rugulosa BPL654]
MAAAMSASSTDELPWGWKQCTFLLVYEAYEFCLILCAQYREGLRRGRARRCCATTVSSQGHALARPVREPEWCSVAQE